MDWNSIANALTTLIHGGNSQQQPQPTPQPNFDQQMINKGFAKGQDGVYRPASVQSPPIVRTSLAQPPIQSPNNSAFRYQMGQRDYSGMKSQIQRVLQNSPLAQYTDTFIQAGNKYGVDPRALITIANNESTLGKNYPSDTYNPFGYTVGGTGYQALKSAGFTSLPMAIDAMTRRFSQDRFQPNDSHYQNYNTFRNDPTVANLQAAYNANPKEAQGWVQNGDAFTSQFQ